MTQASAGWYPQPDGTQRYWDGSAWTDHISPAPGTAEPQPEGVTEPEPMPVVAPEPALAAPAMSAGAAPGPAQPLGQPSYDLESAPKKRKVWPWIVGALAVILLLIVGVIVAIVFFAKNVLDGPVEAVDAYDQAWQTVDCDLMQGATTQAFQARNGFDDCATFAATAQPFADSLGTYTVDVNSTSIVNSTATVVADETWTSVDGDVTKFTYEYTLYKEGDVWLIESVEDIS